MASNFATGHELELSFYKVTISLNMDNSVETNLNLKEIHYAQCAYQCPSGKTSA